MYILQLKEMKLYLVHTPKKEIKTIPNALSRDHHFRKVKLHAINDELVIASL